MIHRTRGVVGATVICAALGSSALAGQKAVTASSAWIKAPGSADGTATAFLVVDNPTMYDVYLVSAATEVAEEVQFREPGAKGSADTQPVKEVTIPAYGKVELTPSGVHLTLGKLKRELKVGETITITLTTDSGGVLQVPAVVKP